MTKKYYAWFTYDGEQYVIRFRVKGSLQYQKKEGTFIDKELYVRSVRDIVSFSALDTSWVNDSSFGYAILLTHKHFRDQRAQGVKRWTPKREVINWD